MTRLQTVRLSRMAGWMLFVVFALSLFSLPGWDGASSLYRQLTWTPIFVIAVLLVLYHKDKSWRLPITMIPGSLLILLIYLCISLAWSPYPFVSFKRVVEMFGVLFVAMAFTRSAISRDRNLTDMVAFSVGFFLVFGLVFAVIVPGTAFDQDHALKAITDQKNTWGQFSLLACLVYSAMVLNSSRLRSVRGALLALGLVSLIASESTTSLLAFLVAIGFGATLKLARGSRARGTVVIGAVVLASGSALICYGLVGGGSFFGFVSHIVFSSTNKSETLTGRTFLWQLISREFWMHPWFGTGFGGFWVEQGKAATDVISRLNWGPPTQAHNGYLDILNETGVIGMLLFVNVLVRHTKNMVRLHRVGLSEFVSIHSVLLVALLISNIAESSFIRETHMLWILLCTSIVMVHVKVHAADRKGACADTHPHVPLVRRDGALSQNEQV